MSLRAEYWRNRLAIAVDRLPPDRMAHAIARIVNRLESIELSEAEKKTDPPAQNLTRQAKIRRAFRSLATGNL